MTDQISIVVPEDCGKPPAEGVADFSETHRFFLSPVDAAVFRLVSVQSLFLVCALSSRIARQSLTEIPVLHVLVDDES